MTVDLQRVRFTERDHPAVRVRWLNAMRDRLIETTKTDAVGISGGQADSVFGTVGALSGGAP